jgi:hypothetical protein
MGILRNDRPGGKNKGVVVNTIDFEANAVIKYLPVRKGRKNTSEYLKKSIINATPFMPDGNSAWVNNYMEKGHVPPFFDKLRPFFDGAGCCMVCHQLGYRRPNQARIK